MSKSEIRQKHAADAVQLRRISHPASHPYKEGPHVSGNGASTQNAPEDKDKNQIIYHPAEDQLVWLTGGVGRTWPATRPGGSRGGVTARAPNHLPYMHLAGTDL